MSNLEPLTFRRLKTFGFLVVLGNVRELLNKLHMSDQSLISIPKSKTWVDFSEIAIAIGLTLFLPYVIHMIPSWDDSPIGAKLLPIFYAPLIAALTRRLHVSLIACAVSPWINYLIIGRPSLAIAAMLCIQLIPFAYIAFKFGNRFSNKFWIGPIAYLVSKPVILVLFYTIPESMPPVQPLVYTLQTTINAIPGVLILGLLGMLSNRFHPPASHA